MDWNSGFSAQYYAHFVDVDTWSDVGRIEITGGSVSRTDESLRVSATIDCVGYDAGERWVRVYLDAKQGETSAHVPLFTGIVTSPSNDIDGNYITNTLDGYSVLKPCEDVLLERGWYIPAGTSGADAIRRLLSVTPAPLTIAENAPLISEAIIAEEGENHLTMADKVLQAIDWRLRILGDGTIELMPKATEPVVSYDPLENDAVEPQMTVERDLFSCPNVFRAVSDNLVGVARDDSIASPLSTVNRGREVWMEETSCELNEGETIAEYAVRRLREEQQRATTASYVRRFNPEALVTDIVSLNYPAQGLVGEYHITSQSIEMGYGARTTEEVSNE